MGTYGWPYGRWRTGCQLLLDFDVSGAMRASMIFRRRLPRHSLISRAPARRAMMRIAAAALMPRHSPGR